MDARRLQQVPGKLHGIQHVMMGQTSCRLHAFAWICSGFSSRSLFLFLSPSLSLSLPSPATSARKVFLDCARKAERDLGRALTTSLMWCVKHV